MYVCICNAITESSVREAIAEGADSVPALRAALGVGSGCGTCNEVVAQMVQGVPAQPVVYHPRASEGLQAVA